MLETIERHMRDCFWSLQLNGFCLHVIFVPRCCSFGTERMNPGFSKIDSPLMEIAPRDRKSVSENMLLIIFNVIASQYSNDFGWILIRESVHASLFGMIWTITRRIWFHCVCLDLWLKRFTLYGIHWSYVKTNDDHRQIIALFYERQSTEVMLKSKKSETHETFYLYEHSTKLCLNNHIILQLTSLALATFHPKLWHFLWTKLHLHSSISIQPIVCVCFTFT